MTDANVLGFIGLGVMGESMCRNLARKSGARVVAYDARSQPLDALAADGVERAACIADVATRAGQTVVVIAVSCLEIIRLAISAPSPRVEAERRVRRAGPRDRPHTTSP